MNHPALVYALTGLVAYLVGAIPFGFLIFYRVKGIDIRTVGSGNIGATNVGRNLGFRYFLLVFALDLLKGFLPAFGLPRLITASGVASPVDLAVYAALAAILGHNFPVYLGFRGGKGVATSLGALLALDAVACVAALVAFLVLFAIWRYVSLASIVGALAFVVTHFARTPAPWTAEERAMSVMTIALFGLIVARHRANIGRLLKGTEPKVPKRRERGRQDRDGTAPAGSPGRIHPGLILGLVVLTFGLMAAIGWVARNASRPIEVAAGPWSLRETHRASTGQQRTTRVAFAQGGNLLAVMCPRYNRVLLYRVTPEQTLDGAREIALNGRPTAIAVAGDRLVVLERPAGDDKHLGPGWWETFRLDGTRDGGRVPAGYYPDDLAATPDGKHILVLSSGRAEGDQAKPLPTLEVFSPGRGETGPARIGRLELDPSEDPDRLALSTAGTRALVTLRLSPQTLAIDLADLSSPRVVGRTARDQADAPYVSTSPDGDWIIMPSLREAEAVPLPLAVPAPARTVGVGYLVYTLPDDSALELVQTSPRRTLGRFPLTGTLNLGTTRPTGLAYSPERGLLAVATKPGTVHFIAVRSRLEEGSPPRRVAWTGR